MSAQPAAFLPEINSEGSTASLATRARPEVENLGISLFRDELYKKDFVKYFSSERRNWVQFGPTWKDFLGDYPYYSK